MNDKKNIIKNLSDFKPIHIELGCGSRKRSPSAVGVDKLDAEDVDIVGDALDVLRKLPDDSIESISSFHFFEHVDNLLLFLTEIERVLISGGEMFAVVPHFTNPFFYSDPTHKNFFGLYTFSYFCQDRIFRRRVPSYARHANLELIKIDLKFKSFRPRYLTYLLRKIVQFFFNTTNWTKEIYEDSFSGIFSCYEIEYTIKKL